MHYFSCHLHSQTQTQCSFQKKNFSYGREVIISEQNDINPKVFHNNFTKYHVIENG